MTRASALSRRRGQEELREAILQAASEVFFEHGYEGASIDAVIERVGGSKRAIYSYFGSKQELFAAIVTEVSERAMAPLVPGGARGHDLEATLHDLGRRYLDVVMSPAVLALYRAVVAEGVRFPELAEAFYGSGPGRASEALSRLLEELKADGRVEVEDSRRAADHFMGMLRDDLHLRVVLGLRAPPDAEEKERSVRQAVRIFLDGCQSGRCPPGPAADGAKGAPRSGVGSGKRRRT